MTVEFAFIHSEEKVGGEWKNCLTYRAKSTGAVSGTYTYYHYGEKVWEEFDTDDLFNDFQEEMDVEDYPILDRYINDCLKFEREEQNW